MKYRIYLIVLLMVLGGSGGTSFSFADEEELSFKVIVHASNPHNSMTKQEISKLFLKKMKRWTKWKRKVRPVDQEENAVIRKTFSKVIHGRKVKSIKAYWQDQVFAGRGKPPYELSSDQDVMDYVAKNPGAIGYISASSEITEKSIKVLQVKLKAKLSDVSW